MDFLTYINTVNLAIQLTLAYSLISAIFLDAVGTHTDDEAISMDLFTKHTKTHRHRHMNSCQPNHVKFSIACSQATRILCISCDPVTAQSRYDEIIEYLLRCGQKSDRKSKYIAMFPDWQKYLLRKLVHSRKKAW